MTVVSDTIADRVGRLILDGSDQENVDHLELVARAAEAHEATRDLLHQSVATARAGGHSWAAIGAVLGLTRQAAQQRFGGAVDKPGGVDQPMDAGGLLGADFKIENGRYRITRIYDNENWNPDLRSPCLLYTSDAADERSSVDLGGRRIIKKKKHK